MSNVNIEPHFVFDISGFDENELYQRNHILNESNNRIIYGLCDGLHIIETDEITIIYGESYLRKDGNISLLCKNKGSYLLSIKQLKR